MKPKVRQIWRNLICVHSPKPTQKFGKCTFDFADGTKYTKYLQEHKFWSKPYQILLSFLLQRESYLTVELTEKNFHQINKIWWKCFHHLGFLFDQSHFEIDWDLLKMNKNENSFLSAFLGMFYWYIDHDIIWRIFFFFFEVKFLHCKNFHFYF